MTAFPPGLTRGAPAGPGWRWLTPAARMAAAVNGAWPLRDGASPLGCDGFPRVATRTPAGGLGSVHTAREFTMATLCRWGVTDRQDDIVVVVSELLTNALRHAMPRPARVWQRAPIRLGLLQPGPCVMCAVSDPSEEVPSPREPDWYEETGRGLHVVASLSDEWGCTPPGATGKVVWATFATRSCW
jgi:histidine kinase-like protein